MRYTLYLLACLGALSPSGGAQTLHTVSPAISSVIGDFTTIQDAVAAAQSGDTIRIYPGDYATGVAWISIDKGLVLQGPGYLHVQNEPNTNTLIGSALLPKLRFNCAGENVVIQGIDQGLVASPMRGIEVERASSLVIDGSRVHFVASLEVADVVIRRSFIYGNGNPLLLPSSNTSASALHIYNSNSVTIESSIFANHPILRNSMQNVNGYGLVRIPGQVTLLNCLFLSGSSNSFTLFEYPPQIVRNCVAAGRDLYSYPGNNVGLQLSPNNPIHHPSYIPLTANVLDSCFTYTSLNGTSDNFVVRPGGPADGTGMGGVDCGPSGGPDPYQPSGITHMPWIYELNTPFQSGVNTGMNLNVKVKATN